MSAIEFAKKYAGIRFIIPSDLIPPGTEAFDGFKYYAHLVGYLNDATVVMELDEKEFRKKCWPLHDGVTLVVHHDDLYERHYPMVLAVNYKRLEKPKNLYERVDRSKQKPVIRPPKPYPTVCKTCKAPARVGKLTMCSNRSCPSRTSLLKMLDIKPTPKGKAILCPHRIQGNFCYKKAVAISKAQSGYHGFYCEAGHRFSVLATDLKVNDMVLLTLGKNDYTDRIWDGTKWEIR